MLKDIEGKKFISEETAEEIACLEIGEKFHEATLVEKSEEGDDHGFHRFLTFTVGDNRDEGFAFGVWVNGEWGMEVHGDVEVERVIPKVVTITKWVTPLIRDVLVQFHNRS